MRKTDRPCPHRSIPTDPVAGAIACRRLLPVPASGYDQRSGEQNGESLSVLGHRGVESAADVAEAVARDPEVARHYSDVQVNALEPAYLNSDTSTYVSFRKEGRIYWTYEKVQLAKGERVLSDGANCVRGRCGNRISWQPRRPVLPKEIEEPTSGQLNTPEVHGQSIGELPAKPVLSGLPPNWAYPESIASLIRGTPFPRLEERRQAVLPVRAEEAWVRQALAKRRRRRPTWTFVPRRLTGDSGGYCARRDGAARSDDPERLEPSAATLLVGEKGIPPGAAVLPALVPPATNWPGPTPRTWRFGNHGARRREALWRRQPTLGRRISL